MNYLTIAPRASAILTLPAETAAAHIALRKYHYQWQKAPIRALLFNASRSASRACARRALKKEKYNKIFNRFYCKKSILTEADLWKL